MTVVRCVKRRSVPITATAVIGTLDVRKHKEEKGRTGGRKWTERGGVVGYGDG